MKTITTLINEIDQRDCDNYQGFLSDIRSNFNKMVSDGNTPLFTTNVDDLYEIFLSGLPEEAKQHYNCRCCRRFVNRFGGIVTISEIGRIVPVMWTKHVPEFFKEAVSRVYRAVASAKVTGVFIPDTAELGVFETGPWEHLAVRVPAKMIHNSKIETAQQASAAKDEEHRLLCEAMNHYSKSTIEQAVNLLRSDDLYRSEKVLGCAEWLMKIRREIEATNTQHRTNLLWRYAATAPTGYCHVRSGMIGTLLDDIAAGMSITAVKAHQQLAYDTLIGKHNVEAQRKALIEEYKASGRSHELQDALKAFHANHADVPRELCYLTGENRKMYLHDMQICQDYAVLNRRTIANIILQNLLGHTVDNYEHFETIHNYIDLQNNIIRKGAVSAQKNEKLLIPINMRDGSLICVGKGNPEWNYSAPHGAGRLFSRGVARKMFTVEAFANEMEGISTPG